MRADVLVAGGGSAGLAAAVAAARLGARTVLVERDAALGGMSPAAFVHSICGLYLLPRDGAPSVLANHGFAAEFAERLCESGGASGPVRMGRVDVLLQHPQAFARLAATIASETANLEIRLNAELVRVAPDFKSVELCREGAREKIEAGTVIDATGDGALAALGGACFEQEPGERLQRPAFIFALEGVDPAATSDDARLKLAQRLVCAVREGLLPSGALGATLRGSDQGSDAFVTVDLAAHGHYEPTDPACLAALAVEGRKLAEALATFLRDSVEGFATSRISALPSRVGVRESRRIVGLYQLTASDLLRGAEFEDAVAVAAWPMEMRETNCGPRLRFSEDGRACEIPLRALRARDHETLFMAGRCLSATHEAQASIRVIGTCLATGEAAGLAAALAASHGHAGADAVRAARESTRR